MVVSLLRNPVFGWYSYWSCRALSFVFATFSAIAVLLLFTYSISILGGWIYAIMACSIGLSVLFLALRLKSTGQRDPELLCLEYQAEAAERGRSEAEKRRLSASSAVLKSELAS